MQYRKFGRLDWKVSALGFGCMRLPTLGGDHSRIDEPEATRMLHYAIDHGVNYIDTAYPYHSGQSEVLLGKVLQGGYRDKVKLATKLPSWQVSEPAGFDRILNEQLGKLQTPTVDLYLLHALRRSSWHKLRDMDVLNWLEKARADGRIRHIGFSFHDDYDAFQEIVDAYSWDFCQIQYNYMDVEEQAGTKGLKYAAARGMGVVIMEPLLGGRLVNPPAEIQALWDSAPTKRTPADWALQWLWSQPEVSVVLSGMSTMPQVEENVASGAAAATSPLTAEEVALVARVRARYQEISPIPCTACEYCLPCANDLKIPELFRRFNNGRTYNEVEAMRREYARLSDDEKASACIACRECEANCPQQIPIADWMVHVHEVLGEGKSYEESGSPQ